MAHPFYGTAAWKKRRALQLAQHPLCSLCMEVCGVVKAATVADHREPWRRARDPRVAFFQGDLVSLCKQCHDSWKQSREKSGRIAGCDINGIPLDPTHPWRKELEERPTPPRGGSILESAGALPDEHLSAVAPVFRRGKNGGQR